MAQVIFSGVLGGVLAHYGISIIESPAECLFWLTFGIGTFAYLDRKN